MNTHNGWTNWDTWNMNLWITNDEGVYRLARSLPLEELEQFGRELLAEGYIHDDINPAEVNWEEIYDSLNGDLA